MADETTVAWHTLMIVAAATARLRERAKHGDGEERLRDLRF